MMLLLHVLHFCLLIVLARGWSSGAPTEACSDIYPAGHNGTNSLDLQANPYRLDLAAFDELGGTLYYVADQSYKIVLSGMSGEEFKGFLVQARTLADNSPVGQFISLGPDQQLSDCVPEESAVTHINASLKTRVSLTWGAPDNGRGQLKFLFAVVDSINTFWVPAVTITLHPCEFPVYVHDGQCVETCPPAMFGNHTTHRCELLPSDYNVALNATAYYAKILSNHPLNTPVFRIKAIISADSNPASIAIVFFQTPAIQNILELEGGSFDTIFISAADLVTRGSESVYETSINLIQHPFSEFYDAAYPIKFNLSIYLLAGGYSEVYSAGLGYIACGLPLYESVGHCVETCPDGQFGNGSITTLTGTCDPFPADRSVALNATVYYAQIYRNNSQSTPVFTVRAIVNASLPQINSLVITLHEDENSNFFGGVSPMITRSESDLVTVGNQRVTDFSFLASNLYTHFNEEDFPVEWFITINLTVSLPSQTLHDTSRGLVKICLSPEFCGNEPVKSPTYCDPTPCCNGGNCTETGDSYYCECAMCWTRENCTEFLEECSTPITPSPTPTTLSCDPNPCSNGGSCSKVNGSSYCDCAICWTGDNCTQIADECTDTRCTTECLNGGTCILTENSESLCDCVIGFTGSTCETKLPSCPVHYCHNGGTCFLVHGQSVCLCRPQFTGSQCETVLCEAEADVPVYPGSSVTYSWSWTEGGRSQTQPCPDICQELIDYPSGAVVERLCHGDSGQWLGTDFTACGLTITSLQLCEASQGKSGVELAATVVQVSSNASALESPTIAVISSIIDNLTESAIGDTQVREAFLSIVDNVLDASTSELLMSQTLANSSTIILQALESFLERVPLDNDTGSVTLTRTNFGVIALSISGLYHTESITQLSFNADLGPVETAYYDNSTISPEQLLVHSGDPPASTTGVISLQDLGTCPENRENERIVYSVFRTNALFLTPETACNQSAIGSIVLGVKKSGSKNCSSQSVIVDLQQLNKVCKMMHNTASREPTCSHYNDGAGKWSSENCKKVSSSGGRTKCDCSQLGHFGLLFDLHPDEPLSPLALAIISYIGAGFSILCLSLFLLTFLSSKTLRRKEHGRILINISVSLLCLYVVFVVAGLVTSVGPLCGLVAALFHYIMLVFFGWTAAEAVFLYHKLAVVLGNPIQHYVWKAGLTVWLVPLLITVISVGPGYEYYVNPYYCRATEWPFWLGHILPFSIINIFNWIVFSVIMAQLIRRRMAVKVNVDQSKKENSRQNFFIAVGLSLLLGLGWGFGLTATSSDLKELTFALQVIFSLFVGSQGVLIFFFHGLRSPQFRLVWASAFGLKGKLGAKAYFAKKRSVSGTEFNLIATGTMLSSEVSKPASLNHNSQVLSQTDTELGGSSFEPVLVGDSVTETVKNSEKCLPYGKCGEECPPQERCGEECPPQERCVQEQPPTLQ